MPVRKRFPDWCQLTYDEEVGPVVAVVQHVHHPSAGSGVTIGPGYDMKDRTAATVQAELVACGVPAALAATLSGGAGLSGQAAEDFKDAHEDDEAIPVASVEALFSLLYPKYHADTRYLVTHRWLVDWNALPVCVRELLIDMRYRGDVNAGRAGARETHHRRHFRGPAGEAGTLAPGEVGLAPGAYGRFRGAGAQPAATDGSLSDAAFWTGFSLPPMQPSGNTNRRITNRLAHLPAVEPLDVVVPVDVGPGRTLDAATIEALFAHTESEHAGGHYPIGANTIWHGGVHLRAPRGSEVRACAAGVVVAARMSDLEPIAHGAYGSRNFVLIRHGQGAGTWYSLYAHLDTHLLDPTDEEVRRVSWLREPLRPALQPGPTVDGVERDSTERYYVGGDLGSRVGTTHYRLRSFSNDGTTVRVHRDLVAEVQALRTSLGATPSVYTTDAHGDGCVLRNVTEAAVRAHVAAHDGCLLRTVEQRLDNNCYVSLRPVSSIQCRVRAPDAPESTESVFLEQVDPFIVPSLRGGMIVQPNRSVAAGDLIGWVGQYGSDGLPAPGTYATSLIHWEIFSAENLMAGVAGWETAEDANEDFTIDTDAVFERVPQVEDFFHDSLNLEADEVEAFYETPAAAGLRTLACMFVSEWGPDLDAALEAMRGRWVTRHLRERVAPYLWWNELVADGRAQDLPASKHVWHYNPIAFLAARAGVAAPPGAAVEVEEPEVQVQSGTWHTIAEGEYLSLLALEFLGDALRWREIYDHALNAEFRALRPDPDLVYPGDRVYIPTAAAAIS